MRPRSGIWRHRLRSLSIRSLLLAFALAVTLPMLGFAGYLLWRLAAAEQLRLSDLAEQTAQGAAAAVERELSANIAKLGVLAASAELDEGDLATFYAQASRSRQAGAEFALRDPGGRLLLHTGVPFGAALPASDPAVAVGATVLARRGPVISDVVRNPIGGEFAVSVAVPVLRDDAPIRYVLEMTLPLRVWLRVLQGSVFDPDASVGLIDREGVFIARLRQHDQFAGRPSGDDLKSLVGQAGSRVRTNALGQKVLFIYRRVASAGWLIGVGVPVDVVEAPVRRSLAVLAALGAVILALSILGALLSGAQIARPVRALATEAAKLGRDETVAPLSTGLTEVNEVARALGAASSALLERRMALRVSEERYRLATEAFQGAVFDFDVNSNVSDRTPRHHELLDEPPGAIPTSKEGWHERIHPDDKSIFLDAREDIYSRGRDKYEAEYRVRRSDGSWVWVWHRALALRDETGAVQRVVGAILDITARREAEDRLKLLVNELNHRVKNTLATVQSIAANSLRDAADLAEARQSFESRLLALSRAHNILTRQNWEGAPLASIAAEVLEPFRVRAADRLVCEGDELFLNPQVAVAIAMGLHELATNAVKYGALSRETGGVEVTWRVDRDSRKATLAWIESGGPVVAAPARRGFGTRLIERSLASDLDGKVVLSFAPEGVRCTLIWSVAA